MASMLLVPSSKWSDKSNDKLQARDFKLVALSSFLLLKHYHPLLKSSHPPFLQDRSTKPVSFLSVCDISKRKKKKRKKEKPKTPSGPVNMDMLFIIHITEECTNGGKLVQERLYLFQTETRYKGSCNQAN